jgi:toxin-antitoxin system PIN domain toxin
MSYSLDANILIYASNKDSAHYEQAIDFLGDCMSEPDPLYLCWPTVFAYLRIATHPSIFASPLSPDEAIRNIESLRLASHVRFISEGEDFWSCYEQSCEGLNARGNLVPDAHIAALLREQGVQRIYSRDRDFLKFPFLKVVDPFN